MRAESPEDESKRYFEQGTKHYNLGEFDEAITAYRRGYDAKPHPIFLFNIGQAYRLSGNQKQAIFFYKSYLRNMPEAPNRAEVDRRIQEMEDQLRQQEQISRANPTGVVAPDETPAPGDTAPPPMPPPAAEEGPDLTVRESPAGDAAQVVSETAPAPAANKPLHEQWWFWGGIGAAVVATVIIVAVVASGGGDGAPDTDYPSVRVFE